MTTPRKQERRFGDFELLQRIGRDGLFHLFRARQVGLDRQVTLKLLPERAVTLERTAVLRREAAAAHQLDHSGVLRIYEVGDVAGVPYIALAPVEGQLLSERLKSNPLPPRLATNLTRQLAEALQHAHERKITHGSLRPEVVWLTRDGQARLAGFGCPIQFEQIDEEMVAPHVGYLAPEQAGGRGAVGRATDLYGLGALLYAMVTGVPPHQGVNVAETLRFIRTHTPVAPSLLQPGVPEALDAVCQKCLQSMPARRYGSERPLARLIAELRRLRDGSAEPDPWYGARRWLRRHGPIVRSAALVFLFGVLPAGWDWQRRRHAWDTITQENASPDTYARAARCFEREYADQPHDPECVAGLTLARFRTGQPIPATAEELPPWQSVADEWTAVRKLTHILELSVHHRSEARRELEAARSAGFIARTEAERRLWTECEHAVAGE
jgi:serine/threonine protein kinase